MSLRLTAAASLVALAALRPAVARAGDGVDLVRFMPEESTVVVVVDVASARDAALFKDGVARLGEIAPDAFSIAKESGLDPANAIDTIVFGGDTASGKERFAGVAEGKGVKLIADTVAKSPASKATRYHGVTYYTGGGAALAYIDKRLFFARPDYIEATIDLALGKAKNAAKSAKATTLRAVIAATDTRNDVWAAVVLPPEESASMKAQGIELTGISIAGSLSDALGLDVRILNATDASATAMLDQIQKAMPQVGPALGNIGLSAAAKSLQIDRDGLAVKLTMTLTRAEIDTLWALVKGSIPGLGGHP